MNERVKNILVDAAKQLAELLAMDNDARHVCDDLHSVVRRWESAGLPGSRAFTRESVMPSPGMGIAMAWAAHRAKLQAVMDDDETRRRRQCAAAKREWVPLAWTS